MISCEAAVSRSCWHLQRRINGTRESNLNGIEGLRKALPTAARGRIVRGHFRVDGMRSTMRWTATLQSTVRRALRTRGKSVLERF